MARDHTRADRIGAGTKGRPYSSGVRRPIRRGVPTPVHAPIRSLLSDDESLERLDAFMIALGERLDAIQDADGSGALEEAGKRALELAADAASLGLPPLAEAAQRVAAGCRLADAARVHTEIVELTDVVARVRLGHRGGPL
jgi:hypothetical protein